MCQMLPEVKKILKAIEIETKKESRKNVSEKENRANSKKKKSTISGQKKNG